MMNLQINTKQTSAVARMLGRLLTLVMLAITWTNAWADDTYVVAGSPASFFSNESWNGSTSSANKMTKLSNGT